MSVFLALFLALQGGVVELRLAPSEVEIGEPVTVELVVRHGVDQRVDLQAARLVPDDSWVLLEAPRVVRALQNGETTTRATFTVLSLEPGTRAFHVDKLKLGGALLASQPTTLAVRAALAPGEDAPRPHTGYREPRPFAGPRSVVPAALVLGIAALLAIALWVWRRSSRKAPEPVRVVTARERLAALGQAREPAAARAAFFECTRLLRETTDRRLARELDGLTDEEWLAATPAALLRPDVHAGLERFLRRAERVKYGLEAPTGFAVEEAVREVNELIDALEAAPNTQEVAA